MSNKLFFLCSFVLYSNLSFSLESNNLHSHKIDSSFFSFLFSSDVQSLPTFRIGLLLPFCNEKNDSLHNLNIDSILSNNSSNIEPYKFYKKSSISIDFFLGFLLSLNKINEINVELNIYDIDEGEKSKTILNNFLKNENSDDFDLIIGPLYIDNFLYFSKNSSSSTPIVNPFSKKSFVIDSLENIFQVQSDVTDYLSQFSNYIFNKHKDDHIILVHKDTVYKNNFIINEFNDTLNLIDTIVPDDIFYTNLMINDIDTTNFNFTQIKVANTVIDSIHHKLDTMGIKNIVVIPSNDNVFVTDILSKLHACRDSGMTVYGLNNLFDFEYLSVHELMDLNVSFPHSSIDTNSVISSFIVDFYNEYDYLPQIKYAKKGFEIGLYFFDLLSKHQSILNHISDMEPKIYLETQYDFRKCKSGGFRNQGFMILRYHDFGYKQLF